MALAVLGFGGFAASAPPLPNDQVVRTAATAFLALLDADARAKATYAMDDEERFNWHFVPRERNGLPLKEMTGEQRAAAHALLGATVSAQGYLKANAIIELERILGVLENRPDRRDPEQYFVTIFGDPSSDEPWAWRFEGHHLALNFTSATGELVVTGPAFWGANPATVPSGPKAGLRVLGDEETVARDLVHSLTDEQRTVAIIQDEAPRDIITGADRRAVLEAYEGLPASDMSERQRQALHGLIAVYLHNMEDGSARAWMHRILEMDPARIYFAWAGGLEPGQGHYYRVHTPDFLIEYDNTQSDANHIHAVWRDLKDDFGEDLLRGHYDTSDHHH
jgi:hypothetical protein